VTAMLPADDTAAPVRVQLRVPAKV
jgi:hypothetical protein